MRTRSKSDRADAPHTDWRIRNSASTRIRPFALHYFTPCLTNTPFYQAGTTQLLFDFIKSSCMYMPTNILSPTCILPTCVCICICSQHILSDDHSVFWCANCFFFSFQHLVYVRIFQSNHRVWSYYCSHVVLSVLIKAHT